MVRLVGHFFCWASIIGACLCVSFGAVLLARWFRLAEYRRRDAEFRAYALLAETRREVARRG